MRLSQVQTFETVFFTGVGDLGKTINAAEGQKVTKFPGLTMTIIDNVGVKVSCYGRFCILPWGAIKSAIGVEEGSKAQDVQQPYPIKVKANTNATGS